MNTISKMLVGAALTAAMVPAAALADPGVDFTGAGSVGFTSQTWTLGYEFSANVDTAVTALGTWNSGISGTFAVGLWDSSGNLLAQTNVDTGGTQDGSAPWVFSAIGPVSLTAGNIYYVGSYGDSYYTYNVSGFTVDPRITFISDAWTGGGLAFPTNHSGTVGFFGGNVELGSAVPEPATWATMVAGIGVVGGAMRRRRKMASLAAA
jgi:hypothetical protein